MSELLLEGAHATLASWADLRAQEIADGASSSDQVRIAWSHQVVGADVLLPVVGDARRCERFEHIADHLLRSTRPEGTARAVVCVGRLWVWAAEVSDGAPTLVLHFEHALRADVARETGEG